ncbi:MAG: hypothetical protein K9G11_03255 [Rickettsiaceae bacterium]|nr:hypothetical protein [Rickettsiaceae bacterium]
MLLFFVLEWLECLESQAIVSSRAVSLRTSVVIQLSNLSFLICMEGVGCPGLPRS